MSDEAKARGIAIDLKKLSQKLGIEAVETVAITGEGVAKLKDAVLKAKLPNPDLVRRVKGDSQLDAIQLLKRRSRIANDLVRGLLVVSRPLKKSIAEAFGRITIRPVSGIPILLLVLLAMYFFVGRFAAGILVDFFENTVFGKYLNPFFINIAEKFIPLQLIKEALVGDYGLITMALTYAFAIIFPIITAFFFFFGLLEDSGYLARLTVLSDRVFKTMGLNGRAILPMALGLGCGTMAVLTARILDTKKERILVSLLLTLAIPCSAQLGVIMGLLGSLSIKAFLLWLGVVMLVMISVGFAAARIIPGARSPFIQEMPPIRLPQLKNIAAKTLARLSWYLKEAVPLFLLGTFILFVADKTGILKWIEALLSPLLVGLLSLPQKATEAFIIGFLRRDYGAAGLYMLAKTGQLDKIQLLVSLVVVTLFVPCIAQFLITIKERGIKVASIIGVSVFIIAFFAGYILNLILRYFVETLGIAVI
ncbi:MAG: nucleoside recognition domain-containing protein, partial [Candidatus Omnitrophota bacterium]|jgi:ferrous iron transport protein B